LRADSDTSAHDVGAGRAQASLPGEAHFGPLASWAGSRTKYLILKPDGIMVNRRLQ